MCDREEVLECPEHVSRFGPRDRATEAATPLPAKGAASSGQRAPVPTGFRSSVVPRADRGGGPAASQGPLPGASDGASLPLVLRAQELPLLGIFLCLCMTLSLEENPASFALCVAMCAGLLPALVMGGRLTARVQTLIDLASDLVLCLVVLGAAQTVGHGLLLFYGALRTLGRPKLLQVLTALAPIAIRLFQDASAASYVVAFDGVFWLFFLILMLGIMFDRSRLVEKAAKDATSTSRIQSELDKALSEVRRQRDAVLGFLAGASHDLLQPLQAARVFCEAALETREGPVRDSKLERAIRGVDDAQAMLRAMLEQLRTESGDAIVRPVGVPLGPQFARLLDRFSETADRKGVALTCAPTRLSALADPDLLQRLLNNLLINALDHAAASRILVGARRHGGKVRLVVIDDGKGIDPANRPSLFLPFARGRTSQGSGLGLASCRAYAELMGGRLWLHETSARGGHFILELQRA